MKVKKLLAAVSVAWLFLGGAPAEASDITAADCAIGGVQAGWRGTYPELPEEFMETALKDAAWKESPFYIRALMEDFPEKSVVYNRSAEDMSIFLTAVRMPQAQTGEDQGEGTAPAKDMYLETISVWNTKEEEHTKTYKRVAKDMQTPRGIHIGSTLEEVRAAYGPEDFADLGENGGGFYLYCTKETAEILKENENYVGVCIVFLISSKTGRVTNISVSNSTGK